MSTRALDLADQVVDLALARAHADHRVDQAGRADDLLDHLGRMFQLVWPWRGRDVDRLVDMLLELFEAQRPVVQRRGQPEAIVDQRLLARAVAVEHAADLRQRDMRLVHEQHEVIGKVVDQRPGRLAGQAPIHVARIVLDPRAVAHLAQHLQVVHRALLEPRRLQQLAAILKLLDALGQLARDIGDRQLKLLAGGDEVLGRVDVERRAAEQHLAGQRIELGDPLDLVAPELDPLGHLGVGREDIERVAAHAEGAAVEIDIVALELQVDQLAQQLVAVADLADPQRHRHLAVVLRRAQAVDRRDRRDDQHIAARQQRLGRGVAQPVDLFVDLGFFFDVQVFAGDVGLGRVHIVVGDKQLDRRLGQQLAKLGVQLRDQRLVMRHHQGRALELLEDLGHDERVMDEQAAAAGQKCFGARDGKIVHVWVIVRATGITSAIGVQRRPQRPRSRCQVSHQSIGNCTSSANARRAVRIATRLERCGARLAGLDELETGARDASACSHFARGQIEAVSAASAAQRRQSERDQHLSFPYGQDERSSAACL